MSPNQNIQLAHPATSIHSPPPLDSDVAGGGASSADEMTVNALAEKKRRLISRVLAPGKGRSSKHDPRHNAHLDEDDFYADADDNLAGDGIEPTYEELTIDSDREREELSRDAEKRRKKERKKRKKEKERRERREREEVRRQDIVIR